MMGYTICDISKLFEQQDNVYGQPRRKPTPSKARCAHASGSAARAGPRTWPNALDTRGCTRSPAASYSLAV
eukprot:COSAG01_NODE_44731_length_416_cov_0.675079_2_plen_70_part_01